MKKRITPTKWIADSYDCVMPFGKYKGYTIRYIIDDDPSYILWLRKQDIVKFSDEILDDARKMAEAIDEEFRRHISPYVKSVSYYGDDFDYFRLDEPH